jgi:hypothetical protein
MHFNPSTSPATHLIYVWAGATQHRFTGEARLRIGDRQYDSPDRLGVTLSWHRDGSDVEIAL